MRNTPGAAREQRGMERGQCGVMEGVSGTKWWEKLRVEKKRKVVEQNGKKMEKMWMWNKGKSV